MDEILYIYATLDDRGTRINSEELSLPATAYKLRDITDRLCQEGTVEFSIAVDVHEKYEFLEPYLDGGYGQCGPKKLYELNALARRLSELDSFGITALKGLLEMEAIKTKGNIELPRLIDLAYSTECCHVVYEAMNDSQLGRFLAENGLAPETEGVPDSVFELLDFEQIGRRHRMAEGSVFAERDSASPGAYVELHDDIVEAYKELELEPKTPDYTILLNLEYGEKRAQLKLPAGERDLNAALEHIGAEDWTGVSWSCADCAAPALAGMIFEETDIAVINGLARGLKGVEPKDMLIYKAILDAAECGNLINAERLTGELDEYRLSSQIRSFTKCAEEKLAAIMPEEDLKLLAQHLNLYGYGRSLLQDRNAVITSYGLVERKDGQPIQAMENQPEQGGMEMM